MIIYFIVLAAIATRFVPHLSNFAPITALAIFSAATLGWKKSLGITLAVRFVSDIFLGFFAWPLMLAVYVSHLLGVLFGVWIKKSSQFKWFRIFGSSVASSVVFFLVTNFAFLYSEYEHNWSGILLAYTNGLPFFRGTLLGDLFYVGLFFGAYALAIKFSSVKFSRRLTQN